MQARTHTCVHIQHPYFPQVFSPRNRRITCAGSLLSLPLGTPPSAACRLCLIFLPSAEPGIIPHVTLPHQAGEEGLARECLWCRSGLARPYFCHIEIPAAVSSFEYLHNLCMGMPFLQHLQPPVNAQPCNNCSVFVVPLALLWSKAGRHPSR